MNCPFKVGQRIREKEPVIMFDGKIVSVGPNLDKGRDAIVTEITERGFKYDYINAPIPWIPRLDMSFMGGECFENGFDTWEAVENDYQV
jgi:hypothetical protein